MRKIDYFELGATLYIPIMNKNLELILKREKYPFLKSVVVCFEDSTKSCDVLNGIKRLEKILKWYKVTNLKLFIRPRNIENLKTLLKLKNISLIDGFALPKFDTKNINNYLSIFLYENHFYFMPILETDEVFSLKKLNSILMELLPFRQKVLSIRVGGEDILSCLHTIRDCKKSIYEIMPLYLVLSNIINTFKPRGFNISSLVYGCFDDFKTLKRELLNDIEHQLFNKTSIHPKQIKIIENSYKVLNDEVIIANKLLFENNAIFSFNGRMYEKTTHSNWAENILKRYKNYGIREETDDK